MKKRIRTSLKAIPEDGMATAEFEYSMDEVLKHGNSISEGIKANQFYEVTEDYMRNTYKVIVGNHVQEGAEE